MKTVSMSGSLRESVGKKDAKKLRKDGKVPCVLYGGSEQIHFAMEEKVFQKILFTPESYFIKLDLEGKEYNAVLKDIQYHPVSDKVLHADLLEFFEDKEIIIDIPVNLEGVAPGIISGGVLDMKFRKLAVRALPGNMPEQIIVNISELEIHDKLHVRDLEQEKFTIMEKSERFVVGVKTTRLAAATDDVEEEGEEEEGEGEEGGEATAPAAEE